MLRDPGKHVLAVAFFTPPGAEIPRNETKYVDVTASTDGGGRGDGEQQAGSGQAYVFSCPYSSLCRQVVTDQQGRVAEFDFMDSDARVKVKVRGEVRSTLAFVTITLLSSSNAMRSSSVFSVFASSC